MAFHNVPPNGFPDLPDVEELEAVVKDVADLKTSKSAKADIAPDFSAEAAYSAGDLVYHNGELYKFTADHAAGAWSAEDTESATISGEIDSLQSSKAAKADIAADFSAETEYEVGDLVYYNGSPYRCTNAHEGEWDADDFAATTIDGELVSLRSGLTNAAKIPSSSDSLLGSIAGGGLSNFTASDDGFLAIYCATGASALTFSAVIKDDSAIKYGVITTATLAAYNSETIGGLFVKKGRTYSVRNAGENEISVYLCT